MSPSFFEAGLQQVARMPGLADPSSTHRHRGQPGRGMDTQPAFGVGEVFPFPEAVEFHFHSV